MSNDNLGHSKTDTEFGRELVASLQEALAHKRGEIELPYRKYPTPMPASRVEEIREKVAKSPEDFERRFHMPARTVDGWEQGRRAPTSPPASS
jgi:putative transcriptional regulator